MEKRKKQQLPYCWEKKKYCSMIDPGLSITALFCDRNEMRVCGGADRDSF
jgi:hypothetical protein